MEENMQIPGAGELLDLWDAGQEVAPTRRALLLLQAALPQETEIAGWTLGRINAALLRLRMRMFGPELVCLADCPACGTVTEAPLAVPALLAGATQENPGLQQIDVGERTLAFRLPVAEDLLQAAAVPSAAGSGALLQRIVVDGAGQPLPEGAERAIATRIEQADPLAHIELGLNCPACRIQWSEALYVIDLLWAEISMLARRIVSEVGRLAQAFGWREAEILAMTPQRRRRYLEWLGA
jgi:hypothetical protein